MGVGQSGKGKKTTGNDVITDDSEGNLILGVGPDGTADAFKTGPNGGMGWERNAVMVEQESMFRDIVQELKKITFHLQILTGEHISNEEVE